ncbi:MAG: tetratricopeptide repeat protein [Synergistales bacterium]|nr:tetratricopeptide repeat protein [Synergistales bacterium]
MNGCSDIPTWGCILVILAALLAAGAPPAREAQATIKEEAQLDQALQEAARCPGSAPVQVTVGDLYYRLFEYELAIEHYRKAQVIAPTSPDISYKLGLAYGTLKETDKAIAAFRRVLEQAPDNRNALYQLGLLSFRVGDRATTRVCASQLREFKDSRAEILDLLFER